MTSFQTLHRHLQTPASHKHPAKTRSQTRLAASQPTEPTALRPLAQAPNTPLTPSLLPTPSKFTLQKLFATSGLASRFNLFRMAVTTSAVRTLSASTTDGDEIMTESSGVLGGSEPSDHSSDDSFIRELKEKISPKTPRPKAGAPKKATPKTKKSTSPKRRRGSEYNYAPSSSGNSTPRSDSGRKSIGSPLTRVEGGRVSKAYKSKTSPKLRGRRLKTGEDEDELVSELNQQAQMSEARAEEEMELEKMLYPGSDLWAPGENRLFEALFMRQYRPMLPSAWTFDFRGIPAPDAIFANSDEHKPTIYSCSGNDAQATRALIRLVQLTGTVRALVQSGNKAKSATTIRAELFRYANWAARDGGFNRHNVLPTFVLEIIDTSLNGGEVTNYMHARMQELAQAHRDFLREGEDDAPMPSIEDVLDGNVAAPPKAAPRYRRCPPVLYGLFIIHTMVIILTVDSAKEPEDAQVSYHVEINFNSPYQGVWNALTVAIPVCMARDDMMERMDDYDRLQPETESDPDA